ncbi:MAG: biotin--[acetyl-CoA-carboxylase] ligase [Winogradskyella sp.]
MHIIKLNAISSTNAYLKALISDSTAKDFTVVVAESQTNGRGQMGTLWQTETGKNLTVSVYKKFCNLKVEQQFYISMVISVAIYKALLVFNIPKLYIKWPNDILSANQKICGILIENIIKGNSLEGSIIGFGLNVNQKNFEALPKASSMCLQSGILFNKEDVLTEVLKQIQLYFEALEKGNFAAITIEYESLLFRKDKASTFKTHTGNTFSGIIKGVSENGMLNVWTEDNVIKTFSLKTISLLY